MQMVDGVKLDTARDSVNINANQKERKREIHYKPKSTQTPTKVIQETQTSHYQYSPLKQLLIIIHPHCQVWVCVGAREPDPTQRRKWREKEKISATGQTRVDGQWNSLVDVC